MKSTRRSHIRNRIFKLDDLKRVASVFDEQARLAKKSDHHHGVKYVICFADDTSLESDSPALLDETVVVIKRPVKVEFSFRNYKLQREMLFSITHGHSEYGNGFSVESNEEAWLTTIFTKLEDFVKGSEPQSFWFSQHSTILASLLALGIGSLGMLLMDIFFSFLGPLQFNFSETGIANQKALRAFVSANHTWFYFIGWLWRWCLGWLWGAVPLAKWVLTSWPVIELDFGAEHLKIEKNRRAKITVVVTLIIVPVILAIIQDIVKKVIY